jgi:hypothetical protein
MIKKTAEVFAHAGQKITDSALNSVDINLPIAGKVVGLATGGVGAGLGAIAGLGVKLAKLGAKGLMSYISAKKASWKSNHAKYVKAKKSGNKDEINKYAMKLAKIKKEIDIASKELQKKKELQKRQR